MTEPLEVLTHCVVCGGSDHERLAVPRRWIGANIFAPVREQLGLVRCNQCRLYFVNPRPGPELLRSFYDDPGYDCHTAEYGDASYAAAHHRLAVLRAHVTHHQSLIDFGCGAGALMRAAIQAGWSDVAGVDVGSRVSERLADEGLQVFSSLERAARSRLVDALVMIHVLEHLPDPAAALQEIDRILAPGGLLLIEVPNVGSLRALIADTALGARLFPKSQRFQAYPIHLYYFGAVQLNRLVGRLGYRCVEFRTSGMGIEELRLASSLTASGRPQPSAVSNPLDRSKKRSAVLRRTAKALMSRARLGEQLLLVWRKPGGPGSRSVPGFR